MRTLSFFSLFGLLLWAVGAAVAAQGYAPAAGDNATSTLDGATTGFGANPVGTRQTIYMRPGQTLTAIDDGVVARQIRFIRPDRRPALKIDRQPAAAGPALWTDGGFLVTAPDLSSTAPSAGPAAYPSYAERPTAALALSPPDASSKSIAYRAAETAVACTVGGTDYAPTGAQPAEMAKTLSDQSGLKSATLASIGYTGNINDAQLNVVKGGGPAESGSPLPNSLIALAVAALLGLGLIVFVPWRRRLVIGT